MQRLWNMYFLRQAEPKASERSEWVKHNLLGWNILSTERGVFYIKRYSFARFFIPPLREWIMHLLSTFVDASVFDLPLFTHKQ